MSEAQTILLGDLSGLQDYLFDVAAEGGGQARRLRARSLFISLLAEAAALRVLGAVDWSRERLVFSAAGKFLLAGPPLTEAARHEAARVTQHISQWLFSETGAALRLALMISDRSPGHSLPEAYDAAQGALLRMKWQPWVNFGNGIGRWSSARLVLPAISPPCDLCRRRAGCHTDRDEDGESRLLCQRCYQDGELGRRLPVARWLELHDAPTLDAWDLAGFGLRVAGGDRPSPEARHVFALTSAYPLSDPRIVPHRLARHIPRQADGDPVEFKDLAARAEGSPLLGVLKLDADNLGATFRKTVQGAPDFGALQRLSQRLDDFFARQVDDMLACPPWDVLYMVFSGGDDLLLVGPWNVVFDFAGHVQQAFARAFAREGLTLSGGLALIKATFPIRRAAGQADDLLHEAKFKPAAGADAPKNQLAAFGQVWKWSDHAVVLNTARKLANWVRQDVMPRGWLHTLLELAESRNHASSSPVTARLAYHIGRNYPWARADGAKGDLRRWAGALMADFDAGRRAETRLLPAILRYALIATRSPSKDKP